MSTPPIKTHFTRVIKIPKDCTTQLGKRKNLIDAGIRETVKKYTTTVENEQAFVYLSGTTSAEQNVVKSNMTADENDTKIFALDSDEDVSDEDTTSNMLKERLYRRASIDSSLNNEDIKSNTNGTNTVEISNSNIESSTYLKSNINAVIDSSQNIDSVPSTPISKSYEHSTNDIVPIEAEVGIGPTTEKIEEEKAVVVSEENMQDVLSLHSLSNSPSPVIDLIAEIEDTKHNSFFNSMEEFENSEFFEDDIDAETNSKNFEISTNKHENELDGIKATASINNHLLDKILRKELPNQNEIIDELKYMRPRYKQASFDFRVEQKTTKEALDNVYVLLKECPGENDYAPDPEGLDVPLMQHQKSALKWMMWRELKMPFGGILADDMGLGKTLSIIALILQEKNSLENGETECDWNLSDGGTLIICPTSLLRQWETEVLSKTKYTALMLLLFYGDINPKDLKRLNSFDIVITTYRTVWGRLGKYLQNINWRRIVVDEAHIIRNVATKTSTAICSLSAKHRWALTGTPIHNKEEDIYALLKFLRYRPFNDKANWATWLNDHKRLSVVVRSAMLRRTKLDLIAQNAIFRLPPRHEKVFEVELSKEELVVHHTVLSFSHTLFEKFLEQREVRSATEEGIPYNPIYRKMDRSSKDYIEFLRKFHVDENNIENFVILVLLLRLRQICCHPGLIEKLLYNDDDVSASKSTSNLTKNCKVPKVTPKEENLDSDTEYELKEPPSIRQILCKKKAVFDLTLPSTKMKCVIDVLNERVLKTKDKAVIVSQWSRFLDIMGEHLTAMGVRVLYFNGRMNVEERLTALDNFQKKHSEARVLLLSLTAGGVGLNLIAANHLFLMEPHWNPQMEAQAQDRIYRMGQNKDTHVYRFICKNSIEERIQSIQQNKLNIANTVLTGAAAVSSGRLTLLDLMKLFGMVSVQMDQRQK